MSVQTTYGFSTPIGIPGGLVDLSPYAIDTFLNEEDSGKMKFGFGVVSGTKPGINIALPTSASTAAKFVGVTVDNRSTEYDLEGNINVRNGAAMGVLRYGRIYVRVGDSVEPAYGDSVYLIISGDDAGCFTNTSGDTAVQVKGRFLGAADATTHVAQVEFFNQSQA